jgi:hypothetical protein
VTALFIYFAAAFGLAYILGHSVITRAAREWAWSMGESVPGLRWLVMLIECPACLGFWLGVYAGIHTSGESPFYPPLVMGFATTGVNFLLASFTGLMPSSSPKE